MTTLEEFLKGKVVKYRGNHVTDGTYEAQADGNTMRVTRWMPNGAMRKLTFNTNTFKSADFFNSIEMVQIDENTG